MPTEPTIPLQRHTAKPRRRNRHVVRRWLKRIVIGLIGLAIAGGIVYAWLPKPVAVDVATVQRVALAVEIDEDGQTRVRDRFVVLAPISGNLQRIDLEPGNRVEQGDIVARIDAPDPALLDERSRREATARLSAALAHKRRAETAIARATAARDAAVREADRSRTLAQHGAITASERERAELTEQLAVRDLAAAQTDLVAAVADVSAARAVLGTADKTTATTAMTVLAPTAGQVLRVVRDSAGPVAAGMPLLELGDPQAIEVVVDVLSSDAARITPGMEVAIENWGGEQQLHARVRRVEPSAFTRLSALGVEEQRVKVIGALDDPPRELGDGFRVEARIFTWRGSGVLAVPASAVFRDRDRWAVYTIEAKRARLRPITIGHRGRVEIEVVHGLSAGDKIVLHPGDRVVDGVRVSGR